MPLEAIEQEIAKAREEARFAKFDAINPYTDNKVSVRIDATEIIGLVYYEWTRPQGKPTAPSLLQ